MKIKEMKTREESGEREDNNTSSCYNFTNSPK